MNGRSPTRRRIRAGLSRAALAGGIGVVALLAVPGTASAADEVIPLLNCTQPAPGGGFTAVVGYDNTTGRDVAIPYGRWNRIVPPKYDGAQPTAFRAGRQDGAFTITVPGTDATWMLGQEQLLISPSQAPACPPATELPEEGNGTGPAIGLAAAGVVGAVLVQRASRRARALGAASHGDA